MSSTGSVTAWINQLQSGDETSLFQLHQRYWPRFITLARKRLKGVPGRYADEEDVVQDAFWSFYRRLRAGHEFRLRDRADFLSLLTHIIACKAINQIDHEIGAQKRGGGRVRDEASVEFPADPEARQPVLALVTGKEPTPLEQALMCDCYDHYLNGLALPLREFAERHLAGFTHREIADQLGCVERTVERKMALVWKRWQEMAAASLSENVVVGTN